MTVRFESLDVSRPRGMLGHQRFIDEERRANHEKGWSNVLDAQDAAVK